MNGERFEQVLDYLCSGIMSKTERQSVRDELYDHLMCRYETNLAVGMDENEAESNAVEVLGDKSTLKLRLSQVHSYAPKPTLKKAMNLLIFGYVMTSFHISFFTGMKEITAFIGSVCIIVALFCLGKSNRKIRHSFYLKSVGCIISWLLYAVEPICSLPFGITAVSGSVSTVLSSVYIVLFILGLKELVSPYINEYTEYTKKIPFDLGVAVNGLWGALITFLFIGFALDGKTSAELQSVLLVGFGLIVIIINLLIMVRSSKLLWNSDHEYKIEDSSAKKKIAAVLAVIIAVIPTVAVDISLATQKAETSAYSIEDCDIPQSEYERICANLLSYGIPEKIVHSLPKSEILRYSYSVNRDDFREELDNYYDEAVNSFHTTVCNDVEAVISICAVGMTDGYGYPCVRILSWVEYLSGGKGYDDALFWEYAQVHLIPQNTDEEYEGDFLLILSEENGKIIKNEPLDIYTDKNGLTDRMTGARFESKEKLMVIHAETLGLADRNGNTLSNYLLEICHRISPFTYYYRSPLNARENRVSNNLLGYLFQQEVTVISWGNLFDNLTEE